MTTLVRILAVCLPFSLFAADPSREIDLLSQLLKWTSGQTVADVGAGDGDFAVAAAARLGDDGAVYATEIDAQKVERLKELIDQSPTLRPVQSSEISSGLPAASCDSVFLRGVYHHLTQPKNVDKDLFRALKPGGRIAVIDFPPKKLLSWFFPIKGLPADRSGHGIDRNIVVRELTEASFRIEKEIPDWPHGHFCVIARKGR